MRRALLGLALLLLPLFLPTGAAQEAFRLSAAPDAEGALVVSVSGAERSRAATLVLTHADPFAGTVVDRIEKVRLEPGHSLTVNWRDLRHDTNFLLRLLDGDVDLPTRPGLAHVHDGDRVDALPALAQEVVAGLDPRGTNYTVGAEYRSVAALSARSTPVVETTSSGHVVLLYERGSDGALVARISRDGSRSFGTELAIGPGAPRHGWRYAAEEDAQGRLFVVYHAAPEDATHVIRAVRIDVKNYSLALSHTLTAPTGSPGLPRQWEPYGIARHPDGRMFLAAHGGIVQKTSNGTSWTEVVQQPHFWAVDEAGRVAFAGLTNAAHPNGGPVLAISAQGAIGIVWTGLPGNPDGGRVAYVLSPDGRSFPAPRSVDAFAGKRGNATVREVAYSPAGELLVAVDLVSPDEPHPPGPYEGIGAWILRLAPSGTSNATRLNDLGPASDSPHGRSGGFAGFAVQGPRVVAAWTGDGHRHAESRDGGVSFTFTGRTPAFRDADRPFSSWHPTVPSRHGVALLPDGSPLVAMTTYPNASIARLFDPQPVASGSPIFQAPPPPTPPIVFHPDPYFPTPVTVVPPPGWLRAVAGTPYLRIMAGQMGEAVVHVRNDGGTALENVQLRVDGTPPGVHVRGLQTVGYLGPHEERTVRLAFVTEPYQGGHNAGLRLTPTIGDLMGEPAFMQLYIDAAPLPYPPTADSTLAPVPGPGLLLVAAAIGLAAAWGARTRRR